MYPWCISFSEECDIVIAEVISFSCTTFINFPCDVLLSSFIIVSRCTCLMFVCIWVCTNSRVQVWRWEVTLRCWAFCLMWDRFPCLNMPGYMTWEFLVILLSTSHLVVGVQKCISTPCTLGIDLSTRIITSCVKKQRKLSYVPKIKPNICIYTWVDYSNFSVTKFQPETTRRKEVHFG